MDGDRAVIVRGIAIGGTIQVYSSRLHQACESLCLKVNNSQPRQVKCKFVKTLSATRVLFKISNPSVHLAYIQLLSVFDARIGLLGVSARFPLSLALG